MVFFGGIWLLIGGGGWYYEAYADARAREYRKVRGK